MKPTWVLSDEDRNKRFNKLHKMKGQHSSRVQNTCIVPSPLKIPELYMKFTMEEQKTIEEVHEQFKSHKQTWIKTLFLLNKEAGLNILEGMFKIAPIKHKNVRFLDEAFHFHFLHNVVPKILKTTSLTTKDIGQILNGRNSAIAHTFKIHQFIKIGQKKQDIKQGSGSSSAMSKQIKELVEDKDNEYLVGLISKLSIGDCLRAPSFEDSYPEGWAINKLIENRHKETVLRMQKWPKDDKNNVSLIINQQHL